MKDRTGLLAALILALVATNASALQLGELRVASHLGQTFTAYVDVLASVAESERVLTATVLPDLFAPPPGVDVSAFQALLLRDGGRIYVRISSPAPVNTPNFSLRVRIAHDGSGLTARYGVALAAVPRQPPTQRPVKRNRRAHSAPATAAAEPAAPHAGGYGPVKSGETLWSIARRSGARNVQTFIDQVFAANPGAFVGGDRNRLKADATLRLPRVSESPPVASSPSSTAPATPATAEPPGAPIVEAMGHTDAGAAGAATPAPRDPGFDAMLLGFDEKMAAIRAKYGEKPAQPNAATVRAGEAAAGSAAVAMATARSPTVPETKATMPPVRKPEPLADPDEPDVTRWWESLPALEIALGALICGILAGVWRAAQQAGAIKQRERTQRTHSSLEADRKADVSRKAENRVKLESEVRQMLTKKTVAPAAAVVALPAADPDTRSPDEAMPRLAGQDRLLAIDANIAHGRYVDAECLLHQVISENPRNFSAKLRLAEVYYITEQVTGFVDIARDLLEHHRAEILNDDWQRVMRMGKIIAPDAAPFSGVRAIYSMQKSR